MTVDRYADNLTFQVVIQYWGILVLFVKQDWVSNFIGVYPPTDGWIGIVALQETVDVVYAIQPAIIQAKDNLVWFCFVENRVVESCRVIISRDIFKDVW